MLKINTAARGNWAAVLGEITRHLLFNNIEEAALSSKNYNFIMTYDLYSAFILI